MPFVVDHRLRRLTVVAYSAILAALVVGTGAYLWAAWHHQQRAVQRQLSDTARLTQVAVQAHLAQYAQALDFLAAQIQADDLTAHPAQATALMQRLQQTLPGFAVLNLVSPSGRVLATTSTRQTRPGAQAPLPHVSHILSALRQHPNQVGLFHPVEGVLAQALVLPIGRTVTAPRGERFAVFGSLRLSEENALYRSLIPHTGLARDLQLGVQDDAGYLFGRWPLANGIDPKTFFTQPRGGAIHQALQAQRRATEGLIRGALNADVSGRPYIGAFHRLQGFPLAAFAVLPLADVQAAWWEQVRMPLLAAGAAGLSLIALFVLSLSAQRRWARKAGSLLRAAEFSATESARQAALLRESTERFINILNELPGGVIVFDAQGQVQYCSAGFVRMMGLHTHPRELIGQSWRAIWQAIAPLHVGGPEALRQIELLFQEHRDTVDEVWLTDGRIVLRHYQPLRDKHQHALGAMWVLQDITTQKRQEEEIRRLAEYDALTGLPNRRAFEARMSELLARPDRAVTLGLIDLDDFKAINDHLGHGAGDAVLRDIATRLASVLRLSLLSKTQRGGDFLARVGGDEFAVLLDGMQSDASLQRSAQRLLRVTQTPVLVEGQPLTVHLSIGLARRQPGQDAMTLLRQADIALYAAKNAGRHRARVFDPAMLLAVETRQAWIAALEEALQEDRLELYVQPILTVRPGQPCAVESAEALLRLRDSHGNVHAAGAFEQVLDDARIAGRIGRWVLQEALRWLSLWQAQGQRLRLAVNLSPHHFLAPDFVGQLQQALEAHPGLPRQALVLELTERGTALDGGRVRQRIEACRAMGVQVSLDDFGTGNASLVHLQDLAVSSLKVDRRFVSDLMNDARDLSITYGLVRTARMIGLQVVAEGVQTPALAQILVAMGCLRLQGYAIARPMPAADLAAWLQTWPERLPWAAALGNSQAIAADGVEAIVSLDAFSRMLQGDADPAFRQQQLAPDAHLRCTLGRWCQQHAGVWGHRPAFRRLLQEHQALHDLARQWLGATHADRSALEDQMRVLNTTVRGAFWEVTLQEAGIAG